MVGGEGLAQSAGIELFNLVIRQIGQPLIAKIVGFAGFIQPFMHFSRIGIDRHLNFIYNRAEIGLKPAVQDFSEMFQIKTLIRRGV